MTTLEILEKARERISDPAKWCQKAYAVTAGGNPIGPREKPARQWCAKGACIAEGDDGDYGPAIEALRIALGSDAIADFNDTHTHAEVLQLFDQAIAAERTKENPS